MHLQAFSKDTTNWTGALDVYEGLHVITLMTVHVEALMPLPSGALSQVLTCERLRTLQSRKLFYWIRESNAQIGI